MKRNKTKIAISILPWIGFKKDVKVGPITFWPWDSSKIQDKDIRNQLDHFFKIFVDHYGKAANMVAICSHGEPYFRMLTEKEYNELLAAINILVFSSICPGVKRGVCSKNNSIAPPSAEHFDIFHQTFTIPDDQFVVVGTRSSTHWEEINKVHISMPWGVFSQWQTNPNDELIAAFNQVFDDRFPSDVRERLFRSLEWFRLAHTGNNNVPETSRLIMMATAFEIYLQIPNTPNKKKCFAETIESTITDENSVSETRTIGQNSLTYTKATWWAWHFYDLRNKIVHGDKVSTEELRYKDWITYNIVADLVFWELVKRELYKLGCIGGKVREWTEISEKFFVRWMMDFDDYHKALDWRKVN